MDFPKYRPRRLRRNEKLRAMVRETSLAPANLIYPLFVGPGKDNAAAGFVDAGRGTVVGGPCGARV